MDPFWQKTLEDARSEFGENIATTWFAPIRVVEIDQRIRRAKLEVPDNWFKDFFSDNYANLLQRQGFELDFVIREPVDKPTPADDAEARARGKAASHVARGEAAALRAGLASNHSFESFVVGSSNRFAAEACMAVAENSGQEHFNPLFLYGGTGLGKTHLVTAIGRRVLHANPDARVLYMSGESFTNDVVEGIRRKAMSAFREKFSGIDMVIIDDIHSIAGKEATQEEFFHRFNELYGRGCHIILTSDRKPQDIPRLEERLRSRFTGGFIDEVRPPDWETKVAILERKAERSGIDLPKDVANFIATNIDSNIRELEGALNGVLARASFTKEPISLPLTEEVLAAHIQHAAATPTIDEIQKAVAKHFNVRVVDLKGTRRHKNIVEPRQIAMWISRRLTSSSFPEIGQQFGGKDHSTVMHSISKVTKRIEDRDPRFRYPVEILLRNFNQTL